jgi:hypothetical protein
MNALEHETRPNLCDTNNVYFSPSLAAAIQHCDSGNCVYVSD